ncbi:MAG: proton-conducting transporter membrane subunit, partial [Candidatus Acidiferrales bacterium]
MIQEQEILRILPELVLAAFGILVMVAEAFLPAGRKHITGPIALLGTLTALVATVVQAGNQGYAFNRLIHVDTFSVFLHFLLLVIAALTILTSMRYLERSRLSPGEFYALILFATVGMGIMASANELVLIFLGLETSSLASYVLVGFRRAEPQSNEA